jgi:hypothetical protein
MQYPSVKSSLRKLGVSSFLLLVLNFMTGCQSEQQYSQLHKGANSSESTTATPQPNTIQLQASQSPQEKEEIKALPEKQMPAAQQVTADELQAVKNAAEEASNPGIVQQQSSPGQVTADELQAIKNAAEEASNPGIVQQQSSSGQVTADDLRGIKRAAEAAGAAEAERKAKFPPIPADAQIQPAINGDQSSIVTTATQEADKYMNEAIREYMTVLNNGLGASTKISRIRSNVESALNILRIAKVQLNNESDKEDLQKKIEVYQQKGDEMISQSEEKMNETNERLRNLGR